MADPVTTNKALIQPPNAADPGVWDQPMNNNAGAIDQVFGGLTVLNAQGLTGTQTLTLAQYRPANIVVTGVPSGPVTYVLPAGVGGFYFVANLCTGANSTVSFGSASVAGTTLILGGGIGAAVVIDPVYGGRRADSIAEEAAGPTGAVQYAGANGFFAGDAGLLYTAATQALALGGPLSIGGALAVTGAFTKRLVLNPGGAHTVAIPVAFSAAGMSLDCAQSNVFTTTLSGNVTTFALANAGDGQTVNWRLQQDGTGNRTMSWPANFRWPGGTAGVLSTAGNSVDLMVATFFATSGTWLASLLKGFA